MSYNDLRKGRLSLVGGEYFLTCVVHNRRPVFTDFKFCRILVKEMSFLESCGILSWSAWVIMPNHFHGLVTPKNGSLSNAVKQLNGRSARKINNEVGATKPLWQPEFYDHALREEEDRISIARYIVANPLRAGLVTNIAEYPHWDSIFL